MQTGVQTLCAAVVNATNKPINHLEINVNQRPAFELQPYADESLPYGKRLTDPDQLVGHEIKVVCDTASGEPAYGADLVIVTKTHCWLVLRPEAGFTCEDGTDITTVSDHMAYKGKKEELSDYLSADQMRRYGLVNGGEYDLIKAKEDEQKNAENQRKAGQLRKQLAELVSGAA